MTKKLLMGNEAIARGAVEAGLNLASAYPGTPSSEIVGTLANWTKDCNFYAEWSVNEKVALEVAAGAAYAGAYSLVAMKQVGLNVASDPLMSVAYIGVKGALVVVVADDPGPHSSQTEQDTRGFAKFAKLPVFDPTSPEEALEMTKAAFELSHRYQMPVFIRPTTRVCHATAGIQEGEIRKNDPEGFVKDSKWVIFPKLAYQRHQWLEEQQIKLAQEFSSSGWNIIQYGNRTGIAVSGVSFLYVTEAVARLGINPTILKIGTPFPAPEQKISEFLTRVDEVIVVEELDPVLEENIIGLAGKVGFQGAVYGKISGDLPKAGEYSIDLVLKTLAGLCKGDKKEDIETYREIVTPPDLPVRPPVLCAGCPHRASFYAVKAATKGMKVIYTGDIGCYTLGNAAPLSMVDTCLCMGAGITIAQGLLQIDSKVPVFAFIGDSTFFHTGIPGVINAVYNNHPIKIILLDNSTTAMTGHQPHPGMGRTAVGKETAVIDPVAIIRACGVGQVETVNPMELKKTVEAVRRAMDYPGVAAVVMKHPCAAITKPKSGYQVDTQICTNCRRCLRELGCPALAAGEKPQITSFCYGCGLCSQVCPSGAIKEVINS